MENIPDIKDLLEQLDESTLKEFLASMKKERTKEKTGGSSWKDWYPELVVKCCHKKPPKRLMDKSTGRLALNQNNK
jgi:hypothetical protein